MKEYTCQKKRVVMCMFLANLFKHLRAESEEAAAKLRLAGLSGKFESNPQLSKKGWKYVQGLDHRTFRMCKVVQGNSTKFHNLVEEVMCLPGYENDILAHQFVEVRCPRLFVPRVAFASLSASNCVMLGRRSLRHKDLNGRKDGAALRCAL